MDVKTIEIRAQDTDSGKVNISIEGEAVLTQEEYKYWKDKIKLLEDSFYRVNFVHYAKDV